MVLLYQINLEKKTFQKKQFIRAWDLGYINSLKRPIFDSQVKSFQMESRLKKGLEFTRRFSNQLGIIQKLEEERLVHFKKSNQLMKKHKDLRTNKDKTVNFFIKEIEKKVNTNCKIFLVKAQKKTQKKIDEIVLLQGKKAIC